ncbi:ribosome maturation factor RimM [Oleiagrimonas soli]|uniref:Ribosome maturation factor RimM n=1 Tax=Oleiagrimonas soli TaxID=1543381 RepID=A0A099CY77_9GAMM|nr:ribosome maturation factor RimM [Oleiagrimonas soli]KGI77980.1 ribosome maturation factor RimM [Oleiagrimonas soli]MBB6183641.1 16S rRNA processing protein RimM [Oleiagrimonas soli]
MTDVGRRVPVGRIVGLSGVRGAVKLESWTEPRARIFDYQPWLLVKAPGTETEMEGVTGREQGKGVIAQLPGIEDRDQAAEWIGSDILVPREALPEPEDGTYYWCDLEGLEVVTTQGVPLGRVHHLFATGANDVMVVRGGGKEHLVPFVLETYVVSIDLDAKRIEVDWDPEF